MARHKTNTSRKPSEKQLAANRANARLSTGPRTQEGKAASSQNALKSGIHAHSQIIRGEDPADLETLTAEYFRDHHPQSAAERALVDILIDSEWTIRRLRKAEAQLWEYQFAHQQEQHERYDDDDDPLPVNQLLGLAVNGIEHTLHRLQRRRDSLHRAYHRALNDLRILQSERPTPPPPDPVPQPQPEPPLPPEPQPPAEPEPQPQPAAPSPHPIGFVPQAPAARLPFPPPRSHANVTC